MRNDWANLNHLQIGRYAEYVAKMEFTLVGFEVYTAEVDDKGIDFVVRNERREFHEIQVSAEQGKQCWRFGSPGKGGHRRKVGVMGRRPPRPQVPNR